MGKFNYEDYRQPWETGPHWELKQEFIEMYSDMFEEDRLLCLAQAYSNIILMNCSYPAPVMEQISHLSKPLKMRKRFQESDDNSQTETPKTEQKRVSEKMKSIYAQSGRPFKQIKFCASEEQLDSTASSNQTDLHQIIPTVSEKMKSIYEQSGRPFKQMKFCASEEQLDSTASPNQTDLHQIIPTDCSSVDPISTSMCNQQIAQSSTVCVGPTWNPTNTSYQFRENVFIEKDKEEEIKKCLGMNFIQRFAQVIRQVHSRFYSPIELILCVASRLKIQHRLSFKIEIDPDTPQHAAIYCSQVLIDNCVIASESCPTKKRAKVVSSETALNVLLTLSNVHAEIRNIYERKDSEQKKFRRINSSKVIEAFSEKIINRIKEEPAVVAVRSIASLLDMEDCVHFEVSELKCTPVADSKALKVSEPKIPELLDSKTRQTLDPKVAQMSEFMCKFFLNDILISTGKGTNEYSARILAVDSGFIKLSNLSDYKIHNGELKACDIKVLSKPKSEKSNSTESDSSIATSSVKKQPFVVNKALLKSTIRDELFLIDKTNYNKEGQRNFRSTIVESANFCRKRFEYKCEAIPETIPPSTKVHVLIGGIVVGTGIGFTKDDAKTIACTRAFQDLRKKYYTVKINDTYAEGYIITRSQVFEGESYSNNVLSDNNIGCKMLKNMGWTGGGLGETGIAEPVEAKTHLFGTGLGFENAEAEFKVFKKRLEALLQDFSKIDNFSDLVFSKEFTKLERKEIHRIALKFALQTNSRGIGDERFLSVRHKYNPRRLVTYLADNGGSNGKFELIDDSKTPLEF